MKKKNPLVYTMECILYALKTQHESDLLTFVTLALGVGWAGVVRLPPFLSVMPTW